MRGDVLSVEQDEHGGEPLIELVMKGGHRLTPQATLAEIRARAARSLEQLPDPVRRLEPGTSYAVEVADALKQLAAEVDRRLADHERSR
jgi:predicted component of type VI protein secretion system